MAQASNFLQILLALVELSLGPTKLFVIAMRKMPFGWYIHSEIPLLFLLSGIVTVGSGFTFSKCSTKIFLWCWDGHCRHMQSIGSFLLVGQGGKHVLGFRFLSLLFMDVIFLCPERRHMGKLFLLLYCKKDIITHCVVILAIKNADKRGRKMHIIKTLSSLRSSGGGKVFSKRFQFVPSLPSTLEF